uniref:Gag-pol polyprotein n=1 Tax=Solanum tuberosum TaxID=4113 RepID=M1DBQ3_SOLTU
MMHIQVTRINIQRFIDPVEFQSCLIIPSRTAVQGRPAWRNVEQQDQGVPNAPKVQPQGEVTNAEFRDVIRMLSQVVTNQVAQQREVRQDMANTSKIQ